MNLNEIAEQIRTQDNLSTAHPIFILFDRIKMPTPHGYSDEYVYVDRDDENYEIEGSASGLRTYIKDTLEPRQIPLDIETMTEDALYDLLDKYHKIEEVHVKKIDVFKQAFFTNKSAHDYMESNMHHFEDPYIYCDSLWRNYEMQAIREALMKGEFFVIKEEEQKHES